MITIAARIIVSTPAPMATHTMPDTIPWPIALYSAFGTGIIATCRCAWSSSVAWSGSDLAAMATTET